ncbi:MAG: Uroporphyrinogen synthase [Acidobacteria bacterium]|nr:Uroporphyrinogen synthase [Acidobacteriota bacterium]
MSSVLVVREFDDFSRILMENGFEAINCPTIEVVALDNLSEFENLLNVLDGYDGIFLTSAAAADILRRKLIEKQINYSGRIFILGEKSYKILRNEKLNLFFDKSHNRIIELLETIPSELIENKRFLFIRGDRSLQVIPTFLRKSAEVDETIVYQTKNITIADGRRSEIADKLSRNEINCTCFFSPSGAESFIEQFGVKALRRTKIAVIGKTTASYFEKQNLPVDFISKNASADDYAFELIEYLKNKI